MSASLSPHWARSSACCLHLARHMPCQVNTAARHAHAINASADRAAVRSRALSVVRAALLPRCRSSSRPCVPEHRHLRCLSVPRAPGCAPLLRRKAAVLPLSPRRCTAASYSEAGCRPSPPSPRLCRSSPRGAAFFFGYTCA
jgi:hypothetical protein